MNTSDSDTLLKLSETNETVANPDEDIRGRKVADRSGETLGDVSDLLIDKEEHRVRFIEVASGGFLGIGRDHVLIPVDIVVSITDDTVRIDRTGEDVGAGPDYDPSIVRQRPRETYLDHLGHYGVAPWWSTSYQYPQYPYFR